MKQGIQKPKTELILFHNPILPNQMNQKQLTNPYKCDAMMHVLKDSINLEYSELLTKAISKCNLIYKLRNFI